MSNFKNKLRRFFTGRYGADDLYSFCMFLTVVLIVISVIIGVFLKNTLAGFIVGIVLNAAVVGLFAWSLFRMMSRNIGKRYAENQKFLKLKSRFIIKRKKLPPDTAEYVFRSCKHCKATLRLPHKPGKHTVRCVRCGKTFGVKIK